MLLLSLALGCSNSGLGQTDLAATGSTGDTGGAVGLQDCPWVGSWDLEAVRCSTFDYPDWYDTHTGASLVIEHDPLGGCAVVSTVEGSNCTREESWHIGLPVGIEVVVTMNGITDCQPADCRFDPNDQDEPTCTVGDNTRTIDDATLDDSAEAGTLTIKGLLEDTAPGCSLDLITTWAPR